MGDEWIPVRFNEDTCPTDKHVSLSEIRGAAWDVLGDFVELFTRGLPWDDTKPPEWQYVLRSLRLAVQKARHITERVTPTKEPDLLREAVGELVGLIESDWHRSEWLMRSQTHGAFTKVKALLEEEK